MKIPLRIRCGCINHISSEFLLKMKLTIILLTIAFLQVNAAGYSQQITLTQKNAKLEDVFKQIMKQTDYHFLYLTPMLTKAKPVDIELHDASLSEALTQCFDGQPLTYVIENNTVVVRMKELPSAPVRGRVTSATGEPIPGVTVLVKGTNKGTATDGNGYYELQVSPEDKVLIFSGIGLKKQEIAISGLSQINVVMQIEITNLVEINVVSTGYQVIPKERATGSFVKVDEEMLDKKPVVNIASALIGLTPGMTATSSTDGQFNRFLVRGQGTFQQLIDRDPLVVVDGFAIQGVSQQGTGYNDEKNPFSSINPNDVESITLLKDAAATSIYGARAANGVIVITTKKGKKGESLRVNFGSFVSVTAKPDLDYTYNMASLSSTVKYLENLEKYSLQYNDSWKDPYYSTTNPFIYLSKAAELLHEYKRKSNITQDQYNAGISALMADEGKWKDDYNTYLFRNQVNQQYNFNVTGNTERNSYVFSAVYDKELSTSIATEKSKIVLNFSNTYELSKRLSFTFGVNTHFGKNVNNGYGITELMNSTSPYTRLKLDDGTYPHFPTTSTVYRPIYNAKFAGKLPVSWDYNPLKDRDARENTSNIFNLRLQSSLNYKIIEGLNLSLKGQYEKNTYTNRVLYTPESFLMRNYNIQFSTLNTTTGKYATYFPSGSMYSEGGEKYTSYNFRGQLDYNKTFFTNHEISSILGAEILSSTSNTDPRYTRYGYNPNTNAVMTIPDYMTRVTNIFGVSTFYPYATLPGLSSYEERFLSAYFNVNYTYKRKYTITGSARSDASNFVSDEVRNKISPFWSLGGAWNISKENFMQGISFIDNLKLRASYGIAGLAAGKRSVSTLTTVSVGSPSLTGTNNEPYNGVSLRGNPTLTWEKSRTTNIGLDFSMFMGKLYGSLEYYYRYSYDVLAPAPVPYIAQAQSTATYNNAIIANKGIELSLGSRQNITNYISWKGDLNLSYNKTAVLEHLAIPTGVGSYNGSVYYPGRPISVIYAYKLIGYTPEGYPKMEGKDGTIQIVTDRASTHLYDLLNGAKGQTIDSSNWLRYYGTTVPVVNIGLTNTFKIHNFTVSFMLTGKFGYFFKRTDGPSNAQTSAAYAKTLDNAFANDKNGYTGAYTEMPLYNDNNATVFNTGFAYPYMTNLHYSSDAMIEKGDHIRLNEIYVGYELPNTVFGSKSAIKSLNVYAQARSLGILWSANKLGIDPDYQWYSVKPMPMCTVGFKLSF